jgi:hypothetical protein
VDIINKIIRVYTEGNLSYILNKYIDKNYWNEQLKLYFGELYIENMTDFNYSKCFTFGINISDVKAKLSDDQFEEYLKKNSYLYRIEIQISLLGPYIRYIYLKYSLNDQKKVILNSNNKPFNMEHSIYADKLNCFINNEKLNLLGDDILKTKVPGITLELREGDVSVYNCLFEDSSSYYPYE